MCVALRMVDWHYMYRNNRLICHSYMILYNIIMNHYWYDMPLFSTCLCWFLSLHGWLGVVIISH